MLRRLGMCFVLKWILCKREVIMRCFINFMRFGFLDVFLLIIWIIVLLLEWNIMDEFDRVVFYIFIVIIIGKNFCIDMW